MLVIMLRLLIRVFANVVISRRMLLVVIPPLWIGNISVVVMSSCGLQLVLIVRLLMYSNVVMVVTIS